MKVMLRDVNVVFDFGETSWLYTTSRIITSWPGTVMPFVSLVVLQIHCKTDTSIYEYV